MKKMRHVIIDADTGVDDSLAILYALRSPNFKVEGITTCYGNSNAFQSAENSIRLIKLSKCGYEVPVVVGANESIDGGFESAEPELAPYVLSSSVKNIGESLVAAVQGWKDGSMSFDENYVLGLESDAVGLAKNENYESIVPEDIRAMIDEVEQDIIDGKIKVSTAFDLSTDEIAKIRDAMKP